MGSNNKKLAGMMTDTEADMLLYWLTQTDKKEESCPWAELSPRMQDPMCRLCVAAFDYAIDEVAECHYCPCWIIKSGNVFRKARAVLKAYRQLQKEREKSDNP